MIRRVFIILAVGFFLIPCPGEAAMKEMTNDSLKQVEGATGVSSNKEKYPAEDAMDVSPQESELSRFETEIRSLKQSQNYIEFYLLLNKLEKISKKKNCEKILGSQYFLDLCSNFASASQHCQKNLTELESTTKNYKMKELVNNQRRLFAKVNIFYEGFSNHQSGKGMSPDLKELIADIRNGQNVFETEYNKLMSSRY